MYTTFTMLSTENVWKFRRWTVKSVTWCCQLVLISSVLVTSSGGDSDFYNVNEVVLYAAPDGCRTGEFFDTFTFKCKPCDEALHLRVDDSHLSCTCDERSVPWRDYDSTQQGPICRNVSEFFDQHHTVSGGGPRLEMVKFCKAYHVELLNSTVKASTVEGRNIQIFRKTFPPGNESTVCGCKQGTVTFVDQVRQGETRTYCLPVVLLRDVQSYQPFRLAAVNRQNGVVFRQIKYLIVFCHVMRSTRHCHQLANLCVLGFYSLDKFSPCEIFYTYQTYDLSQGMGGGATTKDSAGKMVARLWTVGDTVKPPLFYRRGKYVNEVLEKYLDFSYDANVSNPINGTINFTLIGYDLWGHLRSFQPMHLADLNLCERYSGSQEQRVRFGQSYHRRCRISLRQMLEDFGEPRFLNLYADYYDQKARLLRAVPVLVRKAFSHNDHPDPEKWQLVRRFLLVDGLSGLNENYKAKLYDEDSLGEKYHFVRYASRIELDIRLHADHEKYPNRIAVPLLKIEYRMVNTSQDQPTFFDGLVDFDFHVTFSKKYSFDSLLEILLPIFILLAFTMTLFQTFCHKLRQNKLFYDTEIFLNFVVYLCSNVATALLGVTVIVALHVFVTYKTQQNVKMLLPVEVENALEIFIYLAFSFKLLKLLRVFALMAGIDIFFIDWERPKILDTGIGTVHHHRTHLDTPSIASSATTRPTCDSVSAWRNYFIANEWQELATKRKISMFAHVVLVISVFFLFGFEHWSSRSSGLHITRNEEYLGDDDKVLKIAVGILVYGVIYFAQRVYNFLIYERFIDNALQQFIDVASLANISVFILCMESYGFYIHGRSPHGFSDTDMCSMILQFKREEDNLCGNRGLLPGSEQQTYSILVPKNLRAFYDKLIAPLRNSNFGPHQHLNQTHLVGSAKLSNSGVISGPGGHFEFNFEKTILTYYNVNRFFAAFVDHALKDLDYIIQERSILENVLNCEFQSYVTDNKGVFYIDNGHSFDQVLFYGNESTFFQLELALFTMVVLISGDYLAAIVIVGVVFKAFELVMNYVLKNNLAKKTLIDKRFLI